MTAGACLVEAAVAGGVRPCPEESHRQNGEGDLKFSQVMKPGCPPSPSPETKGELLGVLAGGGSWGGVTPPRAPPLALGLSVPRLIPKAASLL